MAPITSRPLDLIFFVYFTTHIFPTVFLDSYPVLKPLAPNFLKSTNQWYTENFNDPFFINTPNWFKGFTYIELLFHLPFFFYVSIGLWKDATSIRLPMLIYSSHVTTTTFVCLVELIFNKHEGLTNSQRNLLIFFYFPYFLIPLKIFVFHFRKAFVNYIN
ncbi:sigma intracellular receptor 2 [Rhizophagus clarus]|uniref:Efficient mitochondria targeting-associated protein 19 n=1 Tax=Rhizophagus clarus TaxID=94130 RepID=A0A8H3QS55_9GLOM|nr:sigma intracellular receptor 2 [Rhizophagus clarus]